MKVFGAAFTPDHTDPLTVASHQRPLGLALLVDAQLQSEPALQAITRLNDEFNAEIPVILCSDEDALMDVGRQAGSRVTPLRRPFSAETLREAINRSLSALQ